jgi:hypothetical protein
VRSELDEIRGAREAKQAAEALQAEYLERIREGRMRARRKNWTFQIAVAGGGAVFGSFAAYLSFGTELLGLVGAVILLAGAILSFVVTAADQLDRGPSMKALFTLWSVAWVIVGSSVLLIVEVAKDL